MSAPRVLLEEDRVVVVTVQDVNLRFGFRWSATIPPSAIVAVSELTSARFKWEKPARHIQSSSSSSRSRHFATTGGQDRRVPRSVMACAPSDPPTADVVAVGMAGGKMAVGADDAPVVGSAAPNLSNAGGEGRLAPWVSKRSAPCGEAC